MLNAQQPLEFCLQGQNDLIPSFSLNLKVVPICPICNYKKTQITEIYVLAFHQGHERCFVNVCWCHR